MRKITIVAETTFDFGSGQVPKSYFDGSPFPEFPALSILRKTKYEWEDRTAKLVLLPVRALHSWQRGIDSEKIRPLTDPNYPPVKVDQIKGNLVLMDGNHRATSAYVSGYEFVKAMYANFDDPKAQRYWVDKAAFKPLPPHPHIIPFDAGKVFLKG